MPGKSASIPVGNAGAGSAGFGKRDVGEPGAVLPDPPAGAAHDGSGRGEHPDGDQDTAARGAGRSRLESVAGAALAVAQRSSSHSAPTPATAVAREGTHVDAARRPAG